MPQLHGYATASVEITYVPQVVRDFFEQLEKDLNVTFHIIEGKFGEIRRDSPEVQALKIPEEDFVIFDGGSPGSPRIDEGRGYMGDSYESPFRVYANNTFRYVPMNLERRSVRSRQTPADMKLVPRRYQVYSSNYTFLDYEEGTNTIWTRYRLGNFANADFLELAMFPQEVLKGASSSHLDEHWGTLEQRRVARQMHELFTQLHKGKTRAAEAKVESTRATLVQLEKQIAAAWDNARLASNELRVLKEALEDDEQALTTEFEKLRQSVSFEDFQFGIDGTFEVTTRPIYLYKPNRRERVLMGRARIKLALDGTNHFTYYPADGQRYIHPHTDRGHMCMGSYEGHPGRLVQTGHLCAAFEQAIGLLEAFNPRDVGPDGGGSFAEGGASRGRSAFNDTEYLHTDEKWYTRDELRKKKEQERSEGSKKQKNLSAKDEALRKFDELLKV